MRHQPDDVAPRVADARDVVEGAIRIRRVCCLTRGVDVAKDHLPATFEGLPVQLAVGVVDAKGAHRLLTSGPLVEAVTASCAMPGIFAPVEVAGEPLADGGAADRVGLDAWRRWRPGRRAWVHQVARTAGKDVAGDRSGTIWIQTPRSGASFLDLGDVHAQAARARELAVDALARSASDSDGD